MTSEAHKRNLIRIYFELLRKHYDNTPYTSLESAKDDLEEELYNYQKQLEETRIILFELEYFLLYPIPVPRFLTKQLLKILLEEIKRDCKLVISKIISTVDTSIVYTIIETKRKRLYLVLFFLLCTVLSYIVSSTIKKYFYLVTIIVLSLSYIYIYCKLKYLKYFYKQRIAVLETLCQERNDEIDLLKKQIQESKIYNLEDLETQVKIWLEEDKQSLIDSGMRQLRISKLDRDPILSFVGVSYREKISSQILTTDRGIDNIEDKYGKLLINENDFYEEKGLDGEYKYGVFEGVVIFLGETFLSYYRCYWNFLKGAPVDEETCEYLYYSIVSVKTQERSSLRLQNPDEKRKYKDLLSLTTMDGKIVYFKMLDDKKRKIDSGNTKISSYVSEINEAAARIRYWLRQKRVDYQHIKDIDG
ncbi:MAG: hypothetical protein RMZ69_05815 [Nostoc sp. ChiQUE01a]|nr:hypothetical protein [Nostoc sp. ChiQUE01a]